MLPYWLLFCLVLMTCLLPRPLRKSQEELAWVITIIVLALFVGFRHEVGGDWFNYANQFDYVARMSFGQAVRETKDLAYYPLGWIIARAGGAIYLLNFICALVFSVGTVHFCRHQSRPSLALLAAVPYLIIVVGMGYTRQSAAIGCVLIGLVELAKARRLNFVLWVLIGAAFHKTAVLLVPIAGLAHSTNRWLTFLWVAIASVSGYWVFIRDVSDALWQNYVEAEYAFASQGAGIRVAMNALPAAVLLIWRKQLVPRVAERSLWVWFGWMALACIPMLWVSPTGIDRLSLYLIPIQLLVSGRITTLAQSTRMRTLLVLSVCLYFGVVQFVWLVFARNAEDWIPYQNLMISL